MPGHQCLRQSDEHLLVVGDASSDYDVGSVDRVLDGPDTAATAVASLQRLVELHPGVPLRSHGPVPSDTGAAFATALRRAQRLDQGSGGGLGLSAVAFVLLGIPRVEVIDRGWRLETEPANVGRRGSWCAGSSADPLHVAIEHRPS